MACGVTRIATTFPQNRASSCKSSRRIAAHVAHDRHVSTVTQLERADKQEVTKIALRSTSRQRDGKRHAAHREEEAHSTG